MSEKRSREERIYDFAQSVMQVKFVDLINKAFVGIALPNDAFGKEVADQIDWLLGEVTQIGDLKGTKLGMVRRGFPSGKLLDDDERADWHWENKEGEQN
jgi:hypothetical protein